MKIKIIFYILINLNIIQIFSIDNLQTLINKALINNYEFKRNNLKIEEANIEIIGAIGQLLPNVTGSISYAYLSNHYNYSKMGEIELETKTDPQKVVVPDISSYNISTNSFERVKIQEVEGTTIKTKIKEQELKSDIGQNHYRGSINIEQPLFTGGRIITGIIMSVKNKELIIEQIKSIKIDIIIKVTIAYYQYLLSKKYVELTNVWLELQNEYLKNSELLYETGYITDLALVEVKNKTKNVKANLIKANNDLKNSLDYIQYLCNDKTIKEIEGELVFNENELIINNDYNEKNINNRNDIKITRKLFEITKLDIALNAGGISLVPEIGLNIELSYKSTELFRDDWQNKDLNVTIGIGGKIKLFDKFTNEVMLIKKINNYNRVKIGLQEQIDGARLEIRKLLRDYENYLELKNFWEQEMKKSEKNLIEEEIKFKNGNSTNTKLLAKKLENKETELNYYKSIYDLIISHINLKKAIGDFL